MTTDTAANRHLLLDVDGVLNPYRARNNLHGDWRKRRVGDIRIWTSPFIGRWLVDLTRHGVGIVWATTWVNHPVELDQLEDAFGLPGGWHRLTLAAADLAEDGESGKRPGVTAFLDTVAADAHVVWVDDELGTRDMVFAAANTITAVRPDAASGLASARVRQDIVAGLHLDPAISGQLGVPA